MSNIPFHDAQISLLHKVEVGNFAFQACNVKEKGTHLWRLLRNFEILEYRFSFEHFQ